MQNPNVKKAAPAPGFKQQVQRYADQALKTLFGLAARLGRGGEVARNNYTLGLRHLSLGNYGDAVFRFKAVTWLEPENVQAWYYLGNAMLADGNPQAAATAYRRVLSLKPDYEEAAYMLAMARGNRSAPEELPKKMPMSLAISHFDAQAANYDKEQLERFLYKGHLLLNDAVRVHLAQGRVDHALLDIGAGTGLCGPLLRNVSAQVTGIDISDAMLARAMQAKDEQGRKAYDSLLKRDALSYLKEIPAASYDIVIAGNVLSFIGELSEIIGGVALALKPGGIFAFTADKVDGQGYSFDTRHGRFRFSKPYLQKLATDNGLRELQVEEAEVYPDYKMWLAVFKKA